MENQNKELPYYYEDSTHNNGLMAIVSYADSSSGESASSEQCHLCGSLVAYAVSSSESECDDCNNNNVPGNKETIVDNGHVRTKDCDSPQSPDKQSVSSQKSDMSVISIDISPYLSYSLCDDVTPMPSVAWDSPKTIDSLEHNQWPEINVNRQPCCDNWSDTTEYQNVPDDFFDDFQNEHFLEGFVDSDDATSTSQNNEDVDDYDDAIVGIYTILQRLLNTHNNRKQFHLFEYLTRLSLPNAHKKSYEYLVMKSRILRHCYQTLKWMRNLECPRRATESLDSDWK